MELFQLLKSVVKLTDTESNEINNAFRGERIAKGAVFLKQDSLQKKVFYVEEGYIRLYYTKDDKDITFFFFEKGDFLMSLSAVLDNEPEPFNMEALSNCSLRVIQYEEFERLINTVPLLGKFTHMLYLKMIKKFTYKLMVFQFQSAEERYKYMLMNHRNILLNVPLGYIASYLGITQSTLSVIRGKMK